MEIIKTEIGQKQQTKFRILPPETHPNYRLWANYSKFARGRDELVARHLFEGKTFQLKFVNKKIAVELFRQPTARRQQRFSPLDCKLDAKI